jgi:hypothetical protein
MRYVLAIATAAAFLFTGLSAPVFAADKVDKAGEKAPAEAKLTMDQVPAPVRATLEREAKDGTIGDIVKQTRNGQTVYEAKLQKNNAKDRYLHVSADGKLLKRDATRKESKQKEEKAPSASVR